jgi:hypothetical protein
MVVVAERAAVSRATLNQLRAQRGVLRAVLAGTYAALSDYLRGQMAAGRLRPTDPLVAAQALVGPLLLAVAVQPEFWAEAVGTAPPLEQTFAELLQLWLHGLLPHPPADR